VFLVGQLPLDKYLDHRLARILFGSAHPGADHFGKTEERIDVAVFDSRRLLRQPVEFLTGRRRLGAGRSQNGKAPGQ